MTTFDPTKPVQTQDGRKARIICTDAQGDRPVIALVWDESLGRERLTTYYVDGRSIRSDTPSADLINIPEKHVRWVNVYKDTHHRSKESADELAMRGRIACIRIEYEEGEGL